MIYLQTSEYLAKGEQLLKQLTNIMKAIIEVFYLTHPEGRKITLNLCKFQFFDIHMYQTKFT